VTNELARQILGNVEQSSLDSLRRQLLATAVRYARLRVEWQLAGVNERAELDVTRTAAHNALIDACNILSRNMRKHDEDNQWRAQLGDDRKVIGDWACFVHCELGVRAR